ncbi:hypothetical protein PAXRUDRAFT_165743, partial [Paxillus rubicundulus Ve08.2h10]
SISAQCDMMQKFSQHGLVNPAKQITMKGFFQYFANKSKLAFSSEAWTSKNSVYAFVGSVVYWINDDWALHECPLELLPLNGNHSGKVSGKMIFRALKRRGIVNKINPDKEDLYEITRQFPLAYDPGSDPEVLQDMEEMVKEMSQSKLDDENSVSEASLDDDESEGSDSHDDMGVLLGQDASKKIGRPTHKSFIATKLHAVIADILASEVRHKHICCIIRELCEPGDRHLVLIQIMPIRWNTTYAEIAGGIELKPAINCWIDQLDQQLTSKRKQAVSCKKKKWHLSLADLDFLEYFTAIIVVSLSLYYFTCLESDDSYAYSNPGSFSILQSSTS